MIRKSVICLGAEQKILPHLGLWNHAAANSGSDGYPLLWTFLDWFPSIQDLAQAAEEQLLKAWEGLGYYSRVRNMQTAARQVMENMVDIFPILTKILLL